jgi:hypothetical protein
MMGYHDSSIITIIIIIIHLSQFKTLKRLLNLSTTRQGRSQSFHDSRIGNHHHHHHHHPSFTVQNSETVVESLY